MSPSSASCATALALLLALPAGAREAHAAWPDTPLARTRALALLQTLNADLLSHDSATLTLERWCAAHRLATPATVAAVRVRGADKPLPDDLRRILGAGPDEPVAYRRVSLACGDHVLSEADNWYLPRRLTPAMNDALERTDTPFGKAVRPLHFRRNTLSSRLLWSPLPEGWELRAPAPARPGTLAIPHHVLQHRAVLAAADGRPFSVLVETYTGQVLAWPYPASGSKPGSQTNP